MVGGHAGPGGSRETRHTKGLSKSKLNAGKKKKTRRESHSKATLWGGDQLQGR